MKHPFGTALLAAAAALGLSGCATDDYGYGGGIGYASGYYGGYDYGPSWGWYDNYYYPGSGYYVYDRSGGRRAWNDGQRRYWEGRRGNRPGSENWSGFRGNRGAIDQQRREAWRAQRQQQGAATGQGQATNQGWAARREAWRAQRQSQGLSTERGGWRGRSGGGEGVRGGGRGRRGN